MSNKEITAFSTYMVLSGLAQKNSTQSFRSPQQHRQEGICVRKAPQGNPNRRRIYGDHLDCVECQHPTSCQNSSLTFDCVDRPPHRKDWTLPGTPVGRWSVGGERGGSVRLGCDTDICGGLHTHCKSPM